MTTAGEEAVRKAIHVLLSLVAAAIVWRLPAVQAAAILAGATFLALAVELLRRTSASFGPTFRRRLAPLLRDSETTGLTGATTLSIGYTAAAALLPGTPALVGILVAGVADAVAAVVGKRFGRFRYPGGKSVVGSVTFLVVTFALLLAVLDGSRAAVAAVALGLAVVEAFSFRIDDNLYLPLVTAAAVSALLA